MSKPSGNQVVTNKIDANQEARNKEAWEYTRQAAGQGYTPYGGQDVAGQNKYGVQAAQQFGAVSKLAGQGAAALGGDQQAFGSFMNPFQQQVIDQLGNSYDRQRSQAALGANDDATQAGAFGGDRHALLVGERQGALDRSQAEQTGQLLYQGFGDAQQRAAQAANLGLGASQMGFNAGQQLRGNEQQLLDAQRQRFNEQRDWRLRQAQIAQAGASGTPYGTSQSTPTSTNLLGSAAGGAATGAAIGGPWGAAVGGGIGFLGGLI